MLDQTMTEEGASLSDLTRSTSASQELNITELLYLGMRRVVVDSDIEKLSEELNFIYESYNNKTPAAKSKESQKALKEILDRFKEGYGGGAKESSEKNTQIRIEKTLKLYAKYLEFKFKEIGFFDDDFEKYIQNLTFSNQEFNQQGFLVNGNGLLSSILHPDSSGQIDNFLELEQILEKYLLGLTIKTELRVNFGESNSLDQAHNASEIKNILAVFPGSYTINRNNNLSTDIDFACIVGTAERIKLGTIALNNETVEENAFATVLERASMRFANDTTPGMQIHLVPCIKLALAKNIGDVSDHFAIKTQKNITLRDILDLSYNLNKMVIGEINQSKRLAIKKYEKLRTSNPSVKDIKNFVETMYNLGFIEKSDLPFDFLLTGEYQEPPTEDLFKAPKDLEKDYLKSPTERFKARIKSAAKDLPKHNYLKHLLDPKELFKEDSKYRLDSKKIQNLINLFTPKKDLLTIDEVVQNTQESKILAGLVTLRNILDGYMPVSDSKYFYFLKFDKKFKEKYGEGFKEFFYQTSEKSQEVKEEFLFAKPLLVTIATKINNNETSFAREDSLLISLIKDLVSHEEDQNEIKKLFTENRNILNLKNKNGKNIAKILYQFSEEVLLTALEIDDLEVKKELLNKIREFNSEDIEDFHLLHKIFTINFKFNTDEKLLLKILEKYKEVSEKEGVESKAESSFNLFFLLSLSRGNLKVVQALIGTGVNLNFAYKNKNTPLHLAIEKGHLEIVQALIGAGVNLNFADKNKNTPLHLAIEKGHLEIAQALIDAKAEVNMADKQGKTPLHLAIEKGYLEIAHALIDAKADLNIVDENGNTPLHLVIEKGHLKIVEVLIKKELELRQIRESESKMQDDEILSDILLPMNDAQLQSTLDSFYDNYLNINTANALGKTPLHLAIEKGHLEIAQAIIDAKAEVNMADKQGNTPLHLACEKGHVEIAQALIDAKAEVNIANNNGKTPLELADEKIRPTIINYLTIPKSNVELRKRKSCTALSPIKPKQGKGPAGGF